MRQNDGKIAADLVVKKGHEASVEDTGGRDIKQPHKGIAKRSIVTHTATTHATQQTDRQTHRQTDRETHRHAERRGAV
jgi:hypothetical protein